MKKSQMKVWIQTRHLRTLKCMNKQVFFCLFFLVCKNRYATACKDLLTVANSSTNTNTEPELNQLWNFDEWKPTLSSDTRWNPDGGHDKKKVTGGKTWREKFGVFPQQSQSKKKSSRLRLSQPWTQIRFSEHNYLSRSSTHTEQHILTLTNTTTCLLCGRTVNMSDRTEWRAPLTVPPLLAFVVHHSDIAWGDGAEEKEKSRVSLLTQCVCLSLSVCLIFHPKR